MRANLSFVDPKWGFEDEKAYHIVAPLLQEHEHLRTNVRHEQKEVQLHDLRGTEHSLSLEEHGVQYLECDSTLRSDDFNVETMQRYMREISALVSTKLGAELCFAYSYRVRKLQHELKRNRL